MYHRRADSLSFPRISRQQGSPVAATWHSVCPPFAFILIQFTHWLFRIYDFITKQFGASFSQVESAVMQHPGGSYSNGERVPILIDRKFLSPDHICVLSVGISGILTPDVMPPVTSWIDELPSLASCTGDKSDISPGPGLREHVDDLPVDDLPSYGPQPRPVLDEFVSLVAVLPQASSLLNATLAYSKRDEGSPCPYGRVLCATSRLLDLESFDDDSWALYITTTSRLLEETAVLVDRVQLLDCYGRFVILAILPRLWLVTRCVTWEGHRTCTEYSALTDTIFQQMLRFSVLLDLETGRWIDSSSPDRDCDRFIRILVKSAGELRDYRPDVSLEALPFVLKLWLHRPSALQGTDVMSEWIPSLLESAGELVFPKLYQTLSRTVFDDMFRDLGEDIVAKRICEDLDDDSLLDSKLCVSLRVLLFFMHSKALLSRFFAAGICKSAVAALQRQRLSGSADYLEILWLRVNIVLTHALVGRIRSPRTSHSAAETLQSLCSSSVVEFIAYGIVHLLMKEQNCPVSLKNLANLLEELVADLHVSTYRKDAASRVNSQQFIRFRQELRRYWVPGLHALDGMAAADDPTSAVSDLRKAWRTLGTAAGLNESREREHFDKHGSFIIPPRCAWERCIYNLKKPSARLRLCKGCGDVAYCSRQCQMSHWKEGGHKVVCRRVKDH